MNSVLAIPMPGEVSVVNGMHFMAALSLALQSPSLRVDDLSFDRHVRTDANAAAAAALGEPGDALDRDRFGYFRDRAARMVRDFDAQRGIRVDASDYQPGNAVHIARDLDQRLRRVLEDKVVLPDSLDLFPQYDDPPSIGAETASIRRVSLGGEAKFWNGTEADVGRAFVTQREEKITVRHVVTGWSQHMFERQAAAFANFNTFEAKTRAGRRVVFDLVNRTNWYGAKSVGLYGVLDYPWLDKAILPVPLTATQASTFAGCMAIVRAIKGILNHPKNKSGGTFDCTAAITTHRVMTFLSDTIIPDTAGKTILKHIQDTHTTPIVWRESPFLEGKGPSGMDGFLACRLDQEGITIGIVSPYNVIPSRQSATLDEFLAWMSIFGVFMPQVGNNVLAWVSFT